MELSIIFIGLQMNQLADAVKEIHSYIYLYR